MCFPLGWLFCRFFLSRAAGCTWRRSSCARCQTSGSSSPRPWHLTRKSRSTHRGARRATTSSSGLEIALFMVRAGRQSSPLQAIILRTSSTTASFCFPAPEPRSQVGPDNRQGGVSSSRSTGSIQRRSFSRSAATGSPFPPFLPSRLLAFLSPSLSPFFPCP